MTSLIRFSHVASFCWSMVCEKPASLFGSPADSWFVGKGAGTYLAGVRSSSRVNHDLETTFHSIKRS